MSMEFLALHNELITHFSPENQQYNLGIVRIHIIQNPNVADSQFEFRQRIWPEPFNRVCGLSGSEFQSGVNCSFDEALFSNAKA